jgi:hypothetical protein
MFAFGLRLLVVVESLFGVHIPFPFKHLSEIDTDIVLDGFRNKYLPVLFDL